MSILVWTIALACLQPDPKHWSKPADCAELEDAAWRDECYAQIATSVFRLDPAVGEAMMGEIQDPVIRDYIYLAVTREVDPSTRKWCVEIESAQIAARCEALVRRPHLHRELAGERDGAPPPGMR